MPSTITRNRTRTTIALMATTAALTAPAAAQASALHEHHGSDDRVPRVIANAGSKLLPAKKAAALQAKAKRTGRHPAPPRLASTKGLKHAPATILRHDRQPSTGAQQLPMSRREPTTAQAKLFGFHGTYASKKWSLVSWVNYTFSQVVRGFRQPTVYETSDYGYTPTGCGAVANAMFCYGPNTAAFSSSWSSSVFNTYGDAAFAAVMAHEYGHGAMEWLGFRNRGWFAKQLYSEGFADCMAGAWLYWMHYNGYSDNVGRGDRQELFDVMYALGSSNSTTTYDNHGDRNWRTALSTYGWNAGFSGCIAWGRQIAFG